MSVFDHMIERVGRLVRAVQQPPHEHPEHRLDLRRTCWLFVSSSDEPRHLYDIIFAVEMLRQRQTPERCIHVFTDFKNPQRYLEAYGIERVRPLADFTPASARSLHGFEAAVVVVTGHGCARGVGAEDGFLSPHSLLATIRAIPAVARGALVLCQCYAGIFDRLDARSAPPLVLIGATNLYPSISASIKLGAPLRHRNGDPGLESWRANIFLVHLFRWLASPTDTDGDGKLTLVDAYKHAGVLSNKDLAELKSRLFVQANIQSQLLRSLQEKADLTELEKLQRAAVTERLANDLTGIHVHQEPWILNPDLGRAMIVDPVAERSGTR